MVTTTILVFLNIFLIELVLSVDNASVLAIVVNRNLQDEKDRKHALRWGILGAYVLRGVSLLFVSYLIYNPSIGAWFKMLGGLYLCYLFYTHLTPQQDSVEEGNTTFVERMLGKLKLSKLWKTIIIVEFLDIVFSIDNLIACVSLSNDIWIVCGAVFLGILGMRFVAGYFSKLLEKYSSLENSAFVVILLLGIKLVLAGIFDYFSNTLVHRILNAEHTDLFFSLITISVFILPILKQKFFKSKQIQNLDSTTPGEIDNIEIGLPSGAKIRLTEEEANNPKDFFKSKKYLDFTMQNKDELDQFKNLGLNFEYEVSKRIANFKDSK